jgi:hypothetical protein
MVVRGFAAVITLQWPTVTNEGHIHVGVSRRF